MVIIAATRLRGSVWALLGLLIGAWTGCGGPVGPQANDNTNNAVCAPLGDDDGDGIRNDHEGCHDGTDSDGDLIPDFQDADSDNDGVPDEVERGDGGLQTPPPDFDGDGVADFRDGDSDNDGVLDGDEDRNGDGLLGQCVERCDLGSSPCGPDQTCQADGACLPAVTFRCADGETDRLDPDTDGDGVSDGLEGTHVCNAPSESNLLGREGLQLVPLDYVVLAVEPLSQVRRATVVNLGGEDCGNGADDDGDGRADCEDDECLDTDDCGAALVAFDMLDSDGPTAGFAVVRRPRHATPTAEAASIVQELEMLLEPGTLLVQSAGQERTTHDGFPILANITLGLRQTVGMTASGLRNAVAERILGRAPAEVSNLPSESLPGLGYVEIVEATGGFTDTICTTNLDPALERIAADIIRRAEPTVLAHLPIASTLLVALDGVPLPRSRVAGFDYHATDNSLSFVNQNFDPEQNAEVVISYQRWTTDEAQPN